MKKGATKGKIIAASVLGCVLTLQMGAFSVVLETLASGVTELPFAVFVAAMQPIHLAIGLVEGLITAAVLCFVHEARPELLWGVSETAQAKEGWLSFRKTILVLAAAAVVIGGGLSLLASSKPDGLEWSMERVAGTTELEAEGKAYQAASDIQAATSFLPDYTFRDSDSTAGTTVSGIVGAGIVVVLCVGSCYLFRFFRKREKDR
jgi:cobalt/nickel transport system permease protein